MKIARRCLISGKVQGVFYRASTAERASELGVTGYAKNLADGRVEVLACGDEAVVLELCEWLRQGPPAARVESVEIDDARLEEIPMEFKTR